MFWAIQLQNSTSATNLKIRQEDKHYVTLFFRKDTYNFIGIKFNTYADAVKLIRT